MAVLEDFEEIALLGSVRTDRPQSSRIRSWTRARLLRSRA